MGLCAPQADSFIHNIKIKNIDNNKKKRLLLIIFKLLSK